MKKFLDFYCDQSLFMVILVFVMLMGNRIDQQEVEGYILQWMRLCSNESNDFVFICDEI